MGPVRRAMAALCHVCPVCAYARRQPASLVGRALHHPWHAERCPFWKAERERYGAAAADSAAATSQE
jgi:hypothetical protein